MRYCYTLIRIANVKKQTNLAIPPMIRIASGRHAEQPQKSMGELRLLSDL